MCSVWVEPAITSGGFYTLSPQWKSCTTVWSAYVHKECGEKRCAFWNSFQVFFSEGLKCEHCVSCGKSSAGCLERSLEGILQDSGTWCEMQLSNYSTQKAFSLHWIKNNASHHTFRPLSHKLTFYFPLFAQSFCSSLSLLNMASRETARVLIYVQGFLQFCKKFSSQTKVLLSGQQFFFNHSWNQKVEKTHNNQ